MFTTGEFDESSLVPVFGRRSFVDDIGFGGEDFDSCLATLDRLLTRFAQRRISISFTKSIFCQPKVDFLQQGCHSFSVRGRRTTPRVTLIKFLNKESDNWDPRVNTALAQGNNSFCF
ncbi:hypothetical protein PI125_g27280 [Phytophthora idaei]|nr:hypothetical protein PI125_g27280 [Phytophthora idaei]KAG3109927.1 hypothetical protein PI126_g24867 [Phytophthora idaei]